MDRIYSHIMLVLHMTLWTPVGGNVARACSDSYSLSLCEYKYVLASASARTRKSASILLRVYTSTRTHEYEYLHSRVWMVAIASSSPHTRE